MPRRALLVTIAAAGCAGDPGMQPDASLAPDATGDPTAAQLLGAIASCTVIGGTYARDAGGASDVQICGLAGVVHWTADMDIDCDGQMSAQCNVTTDPSYMNQTAATDSMGNPLDAATLPFVVFPAPSTRFDYRTAGLGMRTVVAVIVGDRVEYGVAGDVGPVAIIGEASYAMAQRLGVNPDPRIGGTDGPVAYIAFTGADGRVPVIEDQAAARHLGVARAKALLGLP
jgi:hypothetical protein